MAEAAVAIIRRSACGLDGRYVVNIMCGAIIGTNGAKA